MSIFSLTKKSKKMGIQTFRNVMSLPVELQGDEIEYLNIRDFYSNTLARLEQYQEAAVQAKTNGDQEFLNEINNKIHNIHGILTDLKNRVKSVGENSWAEAFYLVTIHMLNKEVRMVIEDETDNLIGRPRHELKNTGGKGKIK